MIKFLWACIAWLLCTTPGFKLLKWQCLKRPFKHIGEYMGRWWLVDRDWRLPFSIRLHRICREDLDKYLHDHPWDWRTIVLQGWYVEEDEYGNFHLRKQGFTGKKHAHQFHRIDKVSDGGVWTLFIMGRPYNNPWGFMVEDRKIAYKDYRPPNGREM